MRVKKENIFWGLFFILAAVFILFGKLGYLANVSIVSLILAIFFVALLIKSIPKVEFGGIFFSLAFLSIIFTKPLHLEAITPWPVLGAALLCTIGFSMIFKKKHKQIYYHQDGTYEKSAVFNEQDGSQFKFDTSFGSSIKYVNSNDFQMAILDCSFGSMKVYFDNALIQRGNATINLDVSFGGVELFIPKTWKVINHANTAFGAVDEKNTSLGTGENTITLTGNVSFGGVTIHYI